MQSGYTKSDGNPVYRPDIDGLRAVAVVAVLLYHADVPGFSGGYVGVDVFFVISGYLITQLLAGSAASGPRSQLKDFYIRRARRIFPALCVTSMAAALAGVVILLPWDLARFGSYLAATSLLGTNVAVWTDGGYFRSKAAHVPIAHFWSIAIEEQFYLLYPVVFQLICKFLPRYRTSALLLLAVPSFAACIWGSYHAPVANYLLLFSRGWELLLGGALATNLQFSPTPRLLNELLAIGALFTLGWALFSYSTTTPYPGVYALAPCAASAILIYTGRQHGTVAKRFLSVRPLVFTGLISYSLYLWHFPILTLYGYYHIVAVSGLALAIMIVCIYAVSAASWKWIELPIRTRRLLPRNRSFVAVALVLNLAMFAAGVALWKSEGLPRRYPPEVRAAEGHWLKDTEVPPGCLNLPLDQIASGRLCSFGPPDNAAARAVLWGDSHAMALLPVYRKLADAHHLRLYYVVRTTCKPLLGVSNRTYPEGLRRECAQFNAAAAQAVVRLDPRILILNAHWIDADADLVPEPKEADSTASNFSKGLDQTLRRTGSTNRDVCVVLDVPTLNYNLPNAVGVARKRAISEDFLKLSRAEALEQYRGAERNIHEFERQGMLRAVDPKDLLCPENFCIYESNGDLLYKDAEHLSPAGARFVSSAVEDCFRGVAPAAAN